MESVAKGCLRGRHAARHRRYPVIITFQGNVADEELFSPAYSAERLLEVLDRMTLPTNLVVLSIGQVSDSFVKAW